MSSAVFQVGLLLWVWLAMPSSAAVVPDGSVVHSEPEAPLLAVPDKPRQPLPRSSPRSRPASSRTPSAPAAASNSAGASAQEQSVPASSGPTFGPGGSHSGSDPTGSEPLRPLAPAPVSTSSTAPLMTAVFLFVVLAAAGFWLARQRSGED